MPPRPWLHTAVLGLCGFTCLSGCGAKTPLQPVNLSPVVQFLVAFPTTLSPGDSAVVVCGARDPDGDPVVFDWSSDCRLVKQTDSTDITTYGRGNTLVVHAGTCARAPLDTGWVSCFVRDQKGGGAYAGTIHIVIRQ